MKTGAAGPGRGVPHDMRDESCPACAESVSDHQNDVDTWIACSHCGTWYHVMCVRLTNWDDYDKWYCQTCRDSLPLEPKMRAPRRRSHRARPTTDYAAVQEGKPSDPIGRWTSLLAQYKDWPVRVLRVEGSTWTSQWLSTSLEPLISPTLVPAPATQDLDNPASHIPGMRMPPRHTTIRDVAQLVGPDTHVEVIDVRTQMSSRAWTLSMWADYFETPVAKRDKLLNVISLEITGTAMQRMVEAPAMVRENDWVERDWPMHRRPCHADDEARKWPKVQRYVLMGVQGAFTDFHIDFAGTWVYYHVVWGHKMFLFAPPTSANLASYKAWTLSAHQESEWLGDRLQQLTKVEIRTGETMLIPPGWIHAVYTYQDTLVIGGNFLTDHDVAMHWRIEQMEGATHVPRKFRFPHLVRLAWYVAYAWHKRLSHGTSAPPPRVMEGIAQLCKRLEQDVAKMETLPSASKGYKAAWDAVPRDVIRDPRALLQEMQAHCKSHNVPHKRQRRHYER